MNIDLDKLAQLAKSFQRPDPVLDQLVEAWQGERAKSPAQRRAELERWLSFAAELEIGDGPWAKHAGVARRASELFVSRIVAE